MANKIISVFFTNSGVPTTGLTPTADVWELDPLVPAVNTQVVVGAATTEIGGGWYRYDFGTYDSTKDYSITIDGGAILSAVDRYKFAGNESYQQEIAFQTWEESASAHTGADTMGILQNQIAANVTSIRTTDLPAIFNLLDLARKYSTNRTKINKVAKTLTVYDDDCTTVLRVFHLLDSTGTPSTTEVCERDPDATLNAAANAGAGSTDPSPSCP